MGNSSEMGSAAISIAILPKLMENVRVYCCQGILTCHMTFTGSVISLARPESWPRITMISKKLAIVTIIMYFCPSPLQKKYVWLAKQHWCRSVNTLSPEGRLFQVEYAHYHGEIPLSVFIHIFAPPPPPRITTQDRYKSC